MNTAIVIAAIVGVTLVLTVAMIGFVLLKMMDKVDVENKKQRGQDEPEQN